MISRDPQVANYPTNLGTNLGKELINESDWVSIFSSSPLSTGTVPTTFSLPRYSEYFISWTNVTSTGTAGAPSFQGVQMRPGSDPFFAYMQYGSYVDKGVLGYPAGSMFKFSGPGAILLQTYIMPMGGPLGPSWYSGSAGWCRITNHRDNNNINSVISYTSYIDLDEATVDNAYDYVNMVGRGPVGIGGFSSITIEPRFPWTSILSGNISAWGRNL